MNRIIFILIATLISLAKPSHADDKKLSAILEAYLEYEYHSRNYQPPAAGERDRATVGAGGISATGIATQISVLRRKAARAIDPKLDALTTGVSTVSTGGAVFTAVLAHTKEKRLLFLLRGKFYKIEEVMGEKQGQLFLDRLIGGWSLNQLLKGHLDPAELREAEQKMASPWPTPPRERRQILDGAEMIYLCLRANEIDPALGQEVKALVEEHRNSQCSSYRSEATDLILHRMKIRVSEGISRARGNTSQEHYE